jgi:hypothetical protein
MKKLLGHYQIFDWLNYRVNISAAHISFPGFLFCIMEPFHSYLHDEAEAFVVSDMTYSSECFRCLYGVNEDEFCKLYSVVGGPDYGCYRPYVVLYLILLLASIELFIIVCCHYYFLVRKSLADLLLFLKIYPKSRQFEYYFKCASYRSKLYVFHALTKAVRPA